MELEGSHELGEEGTLLLGGLSRGREEHIELGVGNELFPEGLKGSSNLVNITLGSLLGFHVEPGGEGS